MNQLNIERVFAERSYFKRLQPLKFPHTIGVASQPTRYYNNYVAILDMHYPVPDPVNEDELPIVRTYEQRAEPLVVLRSNKWKYKKMVKDSKTFVGIPIVSAYPQERKWNQPVPLQVDCYSVNAEFIDVDLSRRMGTNNELF